MFEPSRADLMNVVCLPGLTDMLALNSILFVIDLSGRPFRWARYRRFCLEVNAECFLFCTVKRCSGSSACSPICSLFYIKVFVALMCRLG